MGGVGPYWCLRPPDTIWWGYRLLLLSCEQQNQQLAPNTHRHEMLLLRGLLLVISLAQPHDLSWDNLEEDKILVTEIEDPMKLILGLHLHLLIFPLLP